MKMYLLTCGMCNGEYCETAHHSLHSSAELAKEAHLRLLNPEHLKGEDAGNKWEPSIGGDTEEFRTGNWGYIVWNIRPLEVDPVDHRMKTSLKCKHCGGSAEYEHLPQQSILWEAMDYEEKHMDCAKALGVDNREALFEKISVPIPAEK